MNITNSPFFKTTFSILPTPLHPPSFVKEGESSNYVKVTRKNIASFLGMASSFKWWVFFDDVTIFLFFVGVLSLIEKSRE